MFPKMPKIHDALWPSRRPAQSSLSPRAPLEHGDRRGKTLAAIAQETIEVLPALLDKLPHLDAAHSTKYELTDLVPLDPVMCPRLQMISDQKIPTQGQIGTPITVLNADSFDAAIRIGKQMRTGREMGPSSTMRGNGRVAVLNLASDKNPGGGWLHGAAAQEEALCFRSSLSLSLHQHYYPWTDRMGLYTRDVLIIRGAMDVGHNLLVPELAPADLPVVSVISVAGLRSPPLSTDRRLFAEIADRDLTKDKVRLCLRVAAREQHRHLILGALGCGAFANPPQDVAACWLEVFREKEFRGGWWDTVCFAVYDSRNEGNFAVFRDVLHNKVV